MKKYTVTFVYSRVITGAGVTYNGKEIVSADTVDGAKKIAYERTSASIIGDDYIIYFKVTGVLPVYRTYLCVCDLVILGKNYTFLQYVGGDSFEKARSVALKAFSDDGIDPTKVTITACKEV